MNWLQELVRLRLHSVLGRDAAFVVGNFTGAPDILPEGVESDPDWDGPVMCTRG